MGASASVIQEYYKAVDYWAEIEVRKDWKLAIWVVEATDVDLIDRFFEIERSPVGQFDDIFFRFDSIYEGDDEKFTEQLWKEYVSWFTEEIDEKYDVLKALKQDGLLTGEYFPRTDIPHTTVYLRTGRHRLLHLFPSRTIERSETYRMVLKSLIRRCTTRNSVSHY